MRLVRLAVTALTLLPRVFNRRILPAALLAYGGAEAATVGPTDRFIPLVQDGGGWSTQISIANLSGKPAVVVAAFMSERGFAEPWRLELRTTAGRVSGGTVELTLGPGATAVIETGGSSGPTMTRGFADTIEVSELPIGVQAAVTQKAGEQIIQSLNIALAPGHERRAVMALDLRDPTRGSELIWVSVTSSVALELVFRNLAGEVALLSKVDLEGRAQVSVKPLERWPELAGFRGTVQWSVSFPLADRYEPRTLAAIQVINANGQPWTALSSMTLPADQASISPY